MLDTISAKQAEQRAKIWKSVKNDPHGVKLLAAQLKNWLSTN